MKCIGVGLTVKSDLRLSFAKEFEFYRLFLMNERWFRSAPGKILTEIIESVMESNSNELVIWLNDLKQKFGYSSENSIKNSFACLKRMNILSDYEVLCRNRVDGAAYLLCLELQTDKWEL